MLDYVALNASAESTTALVWLHPSGSNMCSDVSDIRWFIPDNLPTFIPNGPFCHGRNWWARVWYHQIEDDRVEDDLVYASLSAMRTFVETIKTNHGIEKVVLAGFSNGGSFAAMCGIMLPNLFESVVDFSGYIPRTEDYLRFLSGDHPVREYLSTKDEPLKIQVHHGVRDYVNEFSVTERNVLEIQGVEGLTVELHPHDGGHTIQPDALKALARDAAGL